MKVEKTIKFGRPAINRALVHRAPPAAAPACPKPHPSVAATKPKTSSFANFFPRFVEFNGFYEFLCKSPRPLPISAKKIHNQLALK